MNQNGTELGLTIRMMREKKGMTRPELAEAAGISESHLKKVETGSRRPAVHDRASGICSEKYKACIVNA